jgi:hypothetical protein
MESASLVVLVLVAVLVGRAYAQTRPADYRITSFDRVLVALTTFAIGCSAIGVAVVFAFKFAPEVTMVDRLARGLTVVAIGLAPLAIVFIIMGALSVVRRWEGTHRNGPSI